MNIPTLLRGPIFFLVVPLLASAASASAARLTPVPIEDLFRYSLFSGADLSPDGKHVAAIAGGDEDLRGLIILGFDGDKPVALRGEGGLDVDDVQWLDNDHVIYSVTAGKLFSTGVYVADRRDLRRARRFPAEDLLTIFSRVRNRPGHVLGLTARFEGVVELDATRHLPEFLEPPSLVYARTYEAPKKWDRLMGFGTDFDGELALCYTFRDGRPTLHRYTSNREWQELPIDIDRKVPLAVDPDGRHLWIADYDSADGYRLREYDTAADALGDAIVRDPTYDLADARLYFSPLRRQLAGVSYVQRRLKNQWFHEPFLSVQQAMDQRHPDLDNFLVDFDENETRFLFSSRSDREPGFYTLLDVKTHTSQVVTRVAPWLEKHTFVPVQPISFKASDGVKLEGYLTLPPGTDKAHPAPLVVLVHGGPALRDTRDFDREVQFLATRGYAVLQPNYRGSIGYTPNVSRLKHYDLRRMHDDVTDATKAILKTGLIDPARVAIMGGSFGGYLAVAGVAFEPDLYRCAITNCGVFDWASLARHKERRLTSASYEYYTRRFGDPWKDRKAFEDASPLAHADAIRVPVLIAHGTKDSVVDVAQSRRLAAALKEHGIPHETFFRSLEGHGFYNYENRVAFYRTVERFLARNLASAPADSAATRH